MPKTLLSDPREADEILAEAKVLSAATPVHVLYFAGGLLLDYYAGAWAEHKYNLGVAVYDGAHKFLYDDEAERVLGLPKLRETLIAIGENGKLEPWTRRGRAIELIRNGADAITAPALVNLPDYGIMLLNAAALVDGLPLPAEFHKILADLLRQPEADILPAVRRRVDRYIPLSHNIGTSLKHRGPSALAAFGVDVKVIDSLGRENRITGAAIFTLITLLRYAVNSEDSFVKALWRQKREIWAPSISALYDYCFADPRRKPTHAERISIQHGVKDLPRQQIIVYRQGGRLIPIIRPWVRVEKTTLTRAKLRAVGVAFEGDDNARIAEGISFIPDAALDLIAEGGFIRVWPDLNDRLVKAREKTGDPITADRIAFIIDLAKTIGEIYDGRGGGDYATEGDYYVIRRTPASVVKTLGLEGIKRRRQKGRLAQKVKAALDFAVAGGFINSYYLRDNIYNFLINKRTEPLLSVFGPKAIGAKRKRW